MKEPVKEWIEVRATGPASAVDGATALLVGAGSQGVIEEVPFEPLPFDVVGPFVGDMTKSSEVTTLIGYISADNIPDYLSRAHISLEEAWSGSPKIKDSFSILEKSLTAIGWGLTMSFYKDQAWTEKWKRFLKPVRAGGFLVRPVWSKAAPRPGEHLIEIEPAMAFGTGGHETTRLCLRAIKAAAKTMQVGGSSSMLDIGTGSGVLAIAGGRLGFTRIVGTDIDEVALKNARKNLRINKVAAKLTAKPLSAVRGRFDLVVANIRTVILNDLMEDIVSKVAPGGTLILSGILIEEATDVAACFEATSLKGPEALNTVKIIKCKEWVAVTLCHRCGTAGR